jgi:hypothetical protein
MPALKDFSLISVSSKHAFGEWKQHDLIRHAARPSGRQSVNPSTRQPVSPSDRRQGGRQASKKRQVGKPGKRKQGGKKKAKKMFRNGNIFSYILSI